MINKKQLFNKINERVLQPNDSKYLDGRENRAYWMYFRNRQKECIYYLINLKGNYIRGYEIRWVNKEGSSINTFLDLEIPTLCGGKPEMPVRQKTLIVKEKFSDWEKFCIEFKEKTPDLEWFDR